MKYRAGLLESFKDVSKFPSPHRVDVRQNLLEYDVDSQPRARTFPIIEIVITVGKIHINIVRVIPSIRPWVVHSEPESAVLKTRISANDKLLVKPEVVIVAKIRAETLVRNATVGALETDGLALRRSKISAI